MTTASLDNCREAFEQWYMTRNKRKSVPPRLGDTYVHDAPSFAWAVWQAAARYGMQEAFRYRGIEP
jgi:hypothetical protein